MQANTPKTLDAAWQRIYPVLDILFNRSREGDVGFGAKEYMECYSIIYNYCANSTTGTGSSMIGAHGNAQGPSKSNGEDLYEKLSGFVVDFCNKTSQELSGLMDEELLQRYNERWSYFLFSRRVMSHQAEYINRQFVTREQDSHHRVLKLHDMAVYYWRENVFNPLESKIISQMLKLIKMDREGEAINSSLVKGAVNCLTNLGLYDDDKALETERQGQDLTIYTRAFETPFLQVRRGPLSHVAVDSLATHVPHPHSHTHGVPHYFSPPTPGHRLLLHGRIA
ncbi:MAG: hypothetical protein CML43_14690, partial [Rhodobacteraceae bacterium]|nr:hypothetical protein [Paracoccaceae bacterium]